MNVLRSTYTAFGIILLAALLFVSCEKQFDISSLPSSTSVGVIGDTTYIEKGVWSGFNKPRAIMYGQDQLFYVADTYNNRIVMFNKAGQILSTSVPILHPISLAQDNRLDLLVGAETIEPTTKDTIGVILRIKLVAANHIMSNARIDTIWREPARPKRRYVGIAAALNDEYLVARDGPDNTSPVDPDSRVLRFQYKKIDSVTFVDRFITPLSELQTGAGSSITSINHPTGIATFPKSFVSPNRFKEALSVCIDVSLKDVYVVDASQDSVVKFNSRGRFKAESFGVKTGGITLNRPSGIAIAENTLYVCDTENNRIVLYRLSSGN